MGNFVVVFFACLISSLMIGYLNTLNFKDQAFQRGFMVECVGKSGYYWECEE